MQYDKYGRMKSVGVNGSLVLGAKYQDEVGSAFNESPSCAQIKTMVDYKDGKTYTYYYDDEDTGRLKEYTMTDTVGGNTRTFKVKSIGQNKTQYEFDDNVLNFEQEIKYDENCLISPYVTEAMDNNQFGAEWKFSYDELGRYIGKKDNHFFSNNVPTQIIDYKYGTVLKEKIRLRANVSSGQVNVDTIEHVYDNRGNILSMKETFDLNYGGNGSYTNTYEYNNINQLKKETSKLYGTRNYTYNAEGNISTVSDGTNTDTYMYERGHLKQVSRNGSVTESYTYDSFGNPIQFKNQSNVMTWERGTLLSQYQKGNKTINYQYDGQGRLNKKDIQNGATHEYFYDGNKLLAKEQSNDKKLRFFYDVEGICGFKVGKFDLYIYSKDAQGNVVSLWKERDVVALYIYDAWGKCTVVDKYGNEITDPSNPAVLNPFRWKSQYYDVETGFFAINTPSGTRYYDPEIGQFISPVYSTLNPYAIGGLNPYSICSAFGVSNPLQIPPNRANIYPSLPLVSDGSEDNGSSGWMPNWLKWTIGGVVIAACIIAIPFTGGTSSLFIPVAIGAGTSAGIGILASSYSFKNGWQWNPDAAADAFMWGGITGAVSGYLGGYVGGPQFAQTWWQQGLWNAGINMGLTAGQQLVTTGTIDPLAVGISGVFGFAGGAIGVTSLGQFANGAISGVGLGLAEALAGVLYDDFVVSAQAYDANIMYLLGLKRNPFAFF